MASVVLFTRDLRVHDLPALTAACRAGGPVIPLFVAEPSLLHRSPARARFLASCVDDLDRSLRLRGADLILRRGDTVEEAIRVATEAGAQVIHVTGDASSFARRREERLRARGAEAGIRLEVHPGHAVIEPAAVRPPGRDAYRVFTPYHRVWSTAPRRPILPAPDRIEPMAGVDPGRGLDPEEIRGWPPDLPRGGESTARRLLERFLGSGVASYDRLRDALAEDATSRLSPYLRFGCVSANEVVHRAAAVEGSEGFVRQMAWRDFYLQRLAEDPAIGRIPAASEGDVDPAALEAWRTGTTGFPIVDAAMRQLAREGWMPNRARMIAAVVATRRLAIPWWHGAAHFATMLVDGDVANNTGGWHWAAATGLDPRPARPFNPVLQAARHDPTGDYVRRYVPELAHVPAPDIHAPWSRPGLLEATGYPPPLVEVRLPGPSARSMTSTAATTSSPR